MRQCRALHIRLSLCVVLLTCGYLSAQTAQPITSLPKPPGDNNSSTLPQPQATYTPSNNSSNPDSQTQAPYTPDDSVHPITSLPKPPASSTPDALGYATPPSVNAPPPVPAPTFVPPPSNTLPAPTAQPYNNPNTSTSAPPPAPPQPVPAIDKPLVATMRPAETPPPVVVEHKRVRPFSSFGVAFQVGLAGIGVDVATPLAQHFNLRGGGNIFSYSGNYNDSGDVFMGTAQLRSGNFYLDYFPFHNGFRISPGVVINGTQVSGTTAVAPGTEFDLGDGTYYSSAADPVHGTLAFNFGRKVAPSFTIGFGNIVPRSGKHISFPFEVGFDYAGAPTIALTLVGTVCDTSTPPNCQKIDNDPEAQADLLQQQNQINSDIRFLRFYPILSQGISFSF